MKLRINLKRAAASIAVILPITVLALTVGRHAVFVKAYPHRAPGLRTNKDSQLIHRSGAGRQGHLIGWVNHLVGPFTSIAANL
jgi:hypothetical protein